MQTYAGFGIAAYVSVSPYYPCLVDSMGSFLVVSSTPLTPPILPPFTVFSELSLVFGYRYLDLLPSHAGGGELSNVYMAMQQSMSIAQY